MKKLLIILLFTLFFSFFILPNVWAEYKLEVGIPGQPEALEGSSPSLITYIRSIYLFALGAVGIAALGALVIGGFIYMSSDLIDTKSEAKKWIWGAISGLLLALAAYLILYTINPDLIRLKEPNLESQSTTTIPNQTLPSSH